MSKKIWIVVDSIIVLIIIILSVLLLRCVYFKELSGFVGPLCAGDKHRFVSDVCESCGASIQSQGRFYRNSVNYDYVIDDTVDSEKNFSDYYSSFNEFHDDYIMVTVLSYCFLISFVFLCGFNIYELRCYHRLKIKNKIIKKK